MNRYEFWQGLREWLNKKNEDSNTGPTGIVRSNVLGELIDDLDHSMQDKGKMPWETD